MSPFSFEGAIRRFFVADTEPVKGARAPDRANAAFVPPPAEEVTECMAKLELFLHDQPEPMPVLLKLPLRTCIADHPAALRT